VLVSIAPSFALPLFAVLLWREVGGRDAMLQALLFFALLGNAAVCHAVAGFERSPSGAAGVAGVAGASCVRLGRATPHACAAGRCRKQYSAEID
jgi:hypothetical protein